MCCYIGFCKIFHKFSFSFFLGWGWWWWLWHCFFPCTLITKHLIWVLIQYTNYTPCRRYICSSFLTTVYRHCWLVDTTKGARIDTIYTSIDFPTPPPLWELLPTYPIVCLLVSLVELVSTIVLFLFLINRVVYTTNNNNIMHTPIL